MKKVSVIGLGWLGAPLAKSLMERNIEVVGSKTSSQGVTEMKKQGINASLFNATERFYLKDPNVKALFTAHQQVITLPPKAHHRLDEYPAMITAITKAAAYCGTKRVIFTSSTSVYGALDGVIDEHHQPNPQREQSRILYAVENELKKIKDVEVVILRLAGLIGNGRHPINHLAGRKNVARPDDYINLVHQNDVIAAITAIIETEQLPSTLYNIVAPIHPTRQEYYQSIARAKNLAIPHFEQRKGKKKKILGERITTELPFRYHHPDPYKMPY